MSIVDRWLLRGQRYWLPAALAALAFLGVHAGAALFASAVVGVLWRFPLAATAARDILFAWELSADALIFYAVVFRAPVLGPLRRQATALAREAWRLPLGLLFEPLLAALFGLSGAAAAAQLARASLYISMRGLSDGFARFVGQIGAALVFVLLTATLALPLVSGAVTAARGQKTVRPWRVMLREIPTLILLPLAVLCAFTLWRFLRGWR